jgi:hypothetical protein
MPMSDIQMNEMFKPIISMAIAAAIAGLIVLATFAAPKANAADVKRALPQAFAKGDRLPAAMKGAACSQHGWPNYEQSCQFDLRRPANEARTVRLIALR